MKICEIIVRVTRQVSMAAGALLACCGIASALDPSLAISQYAHTAWTIRDGFFKGQIHTITQTQDGYLWLGTEFGVIRFDGVKAVPWQPPTGQKLPSSYIDSLLAGGDGRLWIGTLQGLASWKDGKLTNYAELAGQPIASLFEDHEGVLWAGTIAPSTARLCAIRQSGVECYGQDGSLGSIVTSLYEENGHLWVNTASGVWQWRPGPPKFYPMPVSPRDHTQGLNDDHGRLLISMRGGITQIVEGKVTAYPIPGTGPHFNPTEMLRDRDDGLWIGTSDRGLFHVHHGEMDAFTQSNGLSGDALETLFEDREGSIWVASVGGLDRFRDYSIPAISVRQGLSGDDPVSILAANDGGVWLAYRLGLNKWNDRTVTTYREKSGLPGIVDSLFQDSGGRIWAFTLQGAAWLQNGRFIPAGQVPPGQVHAIAEDRDGGLWLSHDRGLLRLLGGRVVQQTPWSELGHQQGAISLVTDPVRGGQWLGLYPAGLIYAENGRVRASYSAANGLGAGEVADIRFDGDGTVWASTEGGLSRLKDGRITTLSSVNGLPCDTVHWMMEDDDHSVWLYMACGLVRVERAELGAWAANPRRTIRATVFDSSDGVVVRQLATGYSPRVAKSRDGKFWFRAGPGVSVFDPRHLRSNTLPPPVRIEQITADRKTYDASSDLRLPPLVRDLEIDYTALSLVAPEKNRFRVRLEGRDPDWKDVGNERKAFYNDLPPRNYRFRVMASNNSGVWNEAGAAFDFSIDPAYYQTRWFRALCVAAFLALLWGLYRYRVHQIAEAFNARMDERVGERTRIARELHDTLLQSFQGLMLRLQVVDELLPEGRAKEELELSLERADQAIAEGRDAVQGLRSSAITTNDLAQAVREVGNELAPPGTATFRLVVEGAARDLHPIIRDELYRIAREALRNAFSHARAQHVEAELIYADRQLRLRIRDDGRGIAPAILEEGRPDHYGLPGMRERAKQIGAKLTIWSGVGAGTEIELSLDGSIAYGTPPGRSGLRLFSNTRAGAGRPDTT
jgi:signal transduction histidine kinase/ligand-binding sensor domain-containing protein